MNPAIPYRIAAIVLLLFACGHTVGFLSFKPASAEGLAVLDAMNRVAFDFEGNSRTYGGFYVGFGLTVTAYLLFCAFLAWHMSRMVVAQPGSVAPLAWALVGVQAVSLALIIQYFFIIPVVFTVLVIACLLWGTLLLPRAAA